MNNTEYIDALIARYLAGETRPEEAMELEDWKNQSDNNLAYFNQYLRMHEITSGIKFPVADTEKAWEKLKNRTTFARTKRKIIPFPHRAWRVAASVAVLVAAGLTLIYVLQPGTPAITAYQAQNEPRKIDLSDHSRITIAPQSAITLDRYFGQTHRTVKLKGSAYFNVVHRDELPFVVDAGQVYIRDIGTKFNVRTSPGNDTVSVKVDEGTVLFYDSTGTQITLKAPQQAYYVRLSRKMVVHRSHEVPGLSLRFDFKETTLGEVIKQLEKGYHLSITLQNPALAHCTITTSFNGQDIETVLTIVTETLGLDYTRSDKGYLITGQTCNR